MICDASSSVFLQLHVLYLKTMAIDQDCSESVSLTFEVPILYTAGKNLCYPLLLCEDRCASRNNPVKSTFTSTIRHNLGTVQLLIN